MPGAGPRRTHRPPRPIPGCWWWPAGKAGWARPIFGQPGGGAPAARPPGADHRCRHRSRQRGDPLRPALRSRPGGLPGGPRRSQRHRRSGPGGHLVVAGGTRSTRPPAWRAGTFTAWCRSSSLDLRPTHVLVDLARRARGAGPLLPSGGRRHPAGHHTRAHVSGRRVRRHQGHPSLEPHRPPACGGKPGCVGDGGTAGLPTPAVGRIAFSRISSGLRRRAVPQDQAVRRAVRDQAPFILSRPLAPASRAVRRLADGLERRDRSWGSPPPSFFLPPEGCARRGGILTRSRLAAHHEQVTSGPRRQSVETAAVQDVRDGMMAVSTPGPSYGAGHIRPGQRWVVRYFDEMREYRFTARIGSVQRTPVALAWLELPAQVEEIQRRQHVRLPPSSCPPTCGSKPGRRRAKPGAAGLHGGHQRRRSSTAPGRRAAGGRFLPGGHRAGRGSGDRRARRVRSVERRLPDGRCHWDYGFGFVEIDPADQDRIVRFIFTEQRRLRRQGPA